MKAYICDICRNQAPIVQNSYDLPPKGWYSVSKMNGSYITTHVCSVDCLESYRIRERPPIELQLQPPAPEAAIEEGVEAHD